MKKVPGLMGLLFFALTSFMYAAHAQDRVTLRFEHFLPASSNAQKQVIEPWCADLERESDGRIVCEIYPSMQLGGKPSQLVDLVRNGVIDVAWTALGYSAGRFPRSEVLELPFVLPYDGNAATEIIWDFSQTTGADDFSDYKLLALYSDMGGPIHTSKKEITGLGDLDGLRIRASTRLASKFLTAAKATPVSMPPGQIADSLSKGVIDGAMLGWEAVAPTKLDETTFYHLQTAPDQSAMTLTMLAILMNKNTYERMPADLQAIIDKYSGKSFSQRCGKAWYDATQREEKRVASGADQRIVTLDDEFYQALRYATQPVIDEWVASTDHGLDRTALLGELREQVDNWAASAGQ